MAMRETSFLCFILVHCVAGQGGGQSAEIPPLISPTAEISMPQLSINDIVAPISDHSVDGKTRLLAFGDWGDSRQVHRIDNINKYILSSNPDGILLLGDNFYPAGIAPELGLADPILELFTNHLANQLPPTIPFYAVLGNNDVLRKTGHFQVEFSHIHPNWIMLSDEIFFVRIELSEICIWAINSNSASKSVAAALDVRMEEEINQRSCRWKIFTAHFPMFTAGAYRTTPSVKMFRAFMLPLVRKHSVDFVITGHDHTSQVLQVENLHTVFLISGTAVDTRTDSLDRSAEGMATRGAGLVWGDDSLPNTILSLEFSNDSAQYKFLHITDSGEIAELFAGEKNWTPPAYSPEVMRLASSVSGIIHVEPSGKLDR